MRQFVENSPLPFDKSTWRETARYFLTNVSSALPLDDGRRRDYQRVDDELEAMRSARPSSRRSPSPSSSHATGNIRLASRANHFLLRTEWVPSIILWCVYICQMNFFFPSALWRHVSSIWRLSCWLVTTARYSTSQATNQRPSSSINRINEEAISESHPWWLSDIIPMQLLVMRLSCWSSGDTSTSSV